MKSEKEYLKIMLANVIGRFGDSIDSIAYAWMVYELTGSTSWLAVVVGVNAIPTILFQPFAGVLVDYFDKKKVVVLCDLGRGAVVFTTGMMLILGILKPWHILILTFTNSCFEAVRIPSGLAIIPLVLKKQDYSMGLSLNQSASRIFELIGLGCAGAIIGLLGTGGAIIVDAITFFLSAILFLFLKVPKCKDGNIKEDITIKKYIKDLKAGIAYFKENHIVFVICLIGFLLNITAVPLEKLQAAYVGEWLSLGVNAMSVGSIFMTIGLILGTLLFVYAEKLMSNITILIYGGGVIGILYFGFIFIGDVQSVLVRYAVYAALMCIFGFINSLIGMSVQISFMSTTPDEYIGRAGSIFSAMACSSIPVGSFLLALVLPFLTIGETYLFVGGATIVIFLIIGRLKSVRDLK